jgi:phosphoglycerate dehydrogenase-like enzyme
VKRAGLTARSIDEVFSEVQIVSLRTELVPETRTLINRERLRRMRGLSSDQYRPGRTSCTSQRRC